MCFDKRVIAGLVVVGLAVVVFAPDVVGVVLPLLIVAACPLSMVLMMRSMSRAGASCSTASGGSKAADDEVAELRAELERLRAVQARRVGASTDDRREATAGDR